MARKQSNYKVMGCYDTESTNDSEHTRAFYICYQLSILRDHNFPLDEITNDNVNSLVDITIDRDYKDVYKRFDELAMYGKANGVVPVVMVHNLAFDMYSLADYVNAHEATSICKSTVKPLTISILEDDKPILVFWDTLSFWGKGLAKLGDECRYPKLVGCWDYSQYRTPETQLTDEEIAYSREDVVVPWAYMGYFMRLNPELDEHELGRKLLTKTSTVRYKSQKRCGNIHVFNESGKDKTTGYMWLKQNRMETPKSDYELEMVHSANRGGFTYCARNNAARVFISGNGMHVLKYDANSMHICHALAHKVPTRYREVGPNLLMHRFDDVRKLDYRYIISNYHNPFQGKFFGRFKFTNVRLKKGSIFERDGISTFASSRFKGRYSIVDEGLMSDNEGGYAFNQTVAEHGWCDQASSDADFAFGKFYGASECTLILNEMSTWEFVQQFDYDTVEAVGNGYMTCKSTYATDKSVLSFNNFYRSKTVFKHLKNAYENGDAAGLDFPDFVPQYLADGMKAEDADFRVDVESFYMSVKAELNSLYGMEATNEAKNEILLTKEGFEVDEYRGVEGLPRQPKAWFQYGSHIVGWSRIHQILFMLLLQDKVSAFICGDTDSHKIWTSCTDAEIMEALKPLHDACDVGIETCTSRARKLKEWFPMDGLGWYECEGEVDGFAAAWNKAYIQYAHGKVDITMAGVPCDNKFQLGDGTIVNHSYNKLANWLLDNGWQFTDIANLLIGYNVYIKYSVTGLNQRKNPKWGSFDSRYNQPNAIYLYPETKAVGNTDTRENYVNSLYAKANNPGVNTRNVIIDWPLEKKTPCISYFDVL